MSNPNLLDIEPGGESTQYESIRLYTDTPAKQTGQLGGNSPGTKSEMRTDFDSDNNGQKLSDEDKEEAKKLGGEFISNISGRTDKGIILLDFPSI